MASKPRHEKPVRNKIGRMAPVFSDRGLGNKVFAAYLEGITCWEIIPAGMGT